MRDANICISKGTPKGLNHRICLLEGHPLVGLSLFLLIPSAQKLIVWITAESVLEVIPDCLTCTPALLRSIFLGENG